MLARKSPRRGPNFANTQCEAAQRCVPLSPRLTHQMYMTIQGERVKRGNLRGVVVISPSRGPNYARICNVRQSMAGPRSAWVPTRQVRAAFDGECAKTEDIRGAGTEITASRAQFREYAMRGSPRPHPARLRSPSTRRTYLFKASASKEGIFEAPS